MLSSTQSALTGHANTAAVTDLQQLERSGSGSKSSLVFICIVMFGVFMIFFPIILLKEGFAATPQDADMQQKVLAAQRTVALEPLLMRACAAVLLVGFAGLIL